MTPRVLVLAVLVSLAVAAPAGAATVHLRGTAYSFNDTKTRLKGAKIRVAELPKLSATVRGDGSYDLEVPDKAKITPYIVVPGWHTIHLQTFTTAGEDLERVNFQVPTDAIYKGLAALLAVDLDANGDPTRCAIVSTFMTRNVRDLPFSEFTAYGAHGVGDATASASPSLGTPTYFNEQVIPDRTRVKSSEDGGVIWTEVPDGVYTITAKHPSTRFASFVATCKPGRIVNANPQWGLYELAPASPAKVSSGFTIKGADVALSSLRATKVPKGGDVRVRCTGKRCPFAERTIAAKGATVDVLRALGSRAAKIGPGQTLEVGVYAHAFNATVTRIKIGAGGPLGATTLCVPLGNTLPRRTCPTS